MFGVRQLPAAQGCSQPAETTLTHFHSMRCEGLSRLHACGNVPSVEPERENAPSQKAVAQGAQGSEEPACASVSPARYRFVHHLRRGSSAPVSVCV